MKAVSGKEMCRILEKCGWTLQHVRGSHHKYARPHAGLVIVPVHASRTLKGGTQRAIMKAAGLVDSDL